MCCRRHNGNVLHETQWQCVAGDTMAMCCRSYPRIVRMNAAVVKPAIQCFSRAVAMVPDHTTNGIQQLLKNMPHFSIKPDGCSYRAPRCGPEASSLPGARSVFPFLIVWIAVCFPRRRQHLRDFFIFFYLGIPNNFRAHAGIQTE